MLAMLLAIPCPVSTIAPYFSHLVVDEVEADIDHEVGEHRGRSDPYERADDLPIRLEALKAQPIGTLFDEQLEIHPGRDDHVGGQRGQRGAHDAPVQYRDKERVEYDLDDEQYHHADKGCLWVAVGVLDGVVDRFEEREGNHERVERKIGENALGYIRIHMRGYGVCEQIKYGREREAERRSEYDELGGDAPPFADKPLAVCLPDDRHARGPEALREAYDHADDRHAEGDRSGGVDACDVVDEKPVDERDRALYDAHHERRERKHQQGFGDRTTEYVIAALQCVLF